MASLTNTKIFEFKILSGTAVSNAKSLDGFVPVGIDMSADWDNANLTFQSKALDTDVFDNVYDAAGNELTVTAAADRYIVLDSIAKEALSGVVKIRSGTAALEVNQTADRVIRIFARNAN